MSQRITFLLLALCAAMVAAEDAGGALDDATRQRAEELADRYLAEQDAGAAAPAATDDQALDEAQRLRLDELAERIDVAEEALADGRDEDAGTAYLAARAAQRRLDDAARASATAEALDRRLLAVARSLLALDRAPARAEDTDEAPAAEADRRTGAPADEDAAPAE